MSRRPVEKSLLRRLPLKNLQTRPFRTVSLILLVTFLAFALFGGSVLTASLQRGLESVKARFGADLIAVPLGCDADLESILLQGEPGYFYLDRSFLEQIAQTEGVAQVSAQFYLASTGSDCCELPVQLIGFDPATDFTIQPWIRQSYGGDLNTGALLAGSDIQIRNGTSLTFFGREYPVAAQLERTGTGLDNSVFASMDTLLDLLEASREQGFQFLEDVDPASMVSSILIRTAGGYDTETVAHNIRTRMDGLQLVRTQSMISGIADSMDSFSRLLYILAGAFLPLSLLMLGIVFSVTANERKGEFAMLRMLGATRKRLAGLLLQESLTVSICGGLLGTALAALAVFPFSMAIAQQLGLPYLTPDAPELAARLLICFAVTFSAGPLSAACAAWKISRTDTVLVLQEGKQPC